MSENASDSENISKPAPDVAKPKGARKAKKAKPSKKGIRAKKPAAKPKADRTNKKAEVIAMMKRAKGATLPEIMKATGWQPHTKAAATARVADYFVKQDQIPSGPVDSLKAKLPLSSILRS